MRCTPSPAAVVANAQLESSRRRNRHVYRGGFTPRRGYAVTVGNVVSAAGDTSTDYNFYSKRALLAGVYSATLLYWLNDKSEGYEATWAFLERRVADVLKVPKVMARAGRVLDRLPDPFRLLRTARSL